MLTAGLIFAWAASCMALALVLTDSYLKDPSNTNLAKTAVLAAVCLVLLVVTTLIARLVYWLFRQLRPRSTQSTKNS